MTYDIGLKLVSFHLIVLALFLLAPDALAPSGLFLAESRAGASRDSPHFSRRTEPTASRWRRKLPSGCIWWGCIAYINVSFWQVGGGGKSPIAALRYLERRGAFDRWPGSRAPHLNDYDRRWRRVIFDAPASVIFQRTDDSFARYRRIRRSLTERLSRSPRATAGTGKRVSAFDRPSPDRLILDGEMDGHKIRTQTSTGGVRHVSPSQQHVPLGSTHMIP